MFKSQPTDATTTTDEQARRYINKRALHDEMSPFDLEDFIFTTKQKSTSAGLPSRKGQGARKRNEERGRKIQNDIFNQELAAHFNAKINFANEYRKAFAVTSPSVAVQPDRSLEIETAGLRQVVFDCVDVVQSKKDIVLSEFVPALLHVTAYQVAAKMEHAHMHSTFGLTAFEQVPENHRVVEHVRCTATNTLHGIAGYLDAVGYFYDDAAMVTPYLRRLTYADKDTFIPSDIVMHHVPQVYSEAFRCKFMVPPEPPETYQERIAALQPYRDLAERLGIPLPSYDAAVPGPGRDLEDDLKIVQNGILRIQTIFKEAVVSVDVSNGRGSRSQYVTYASASPFEQNQVWTNLALDAMDLYVGAAFGFCVERPLSLATQDHQLPELYRPPPSALPPERHFCMARRQVHIIVPGLVRVWAANLMLRG